MALESVVERPTFRQSLKTHSPNLRLVDIILPGEFSAPKSTIEVLRFQDTDASYRKVSREVDYSRLWTDRNDR